MTVAQALFWQEFSVTSKKNHYGEVFGLNISAVQVWTREHLNFCSHIMMLIVPQRVP